jgi:acyl-CoA ligase (AMP-forming) (exosortase A-associated)
MAQKTINNFLQNSVSKWPDKIGVVKGNSSLSYRDMNKQSDLLADLLTDKGVEKGDRVGIFLEKSPEQVIAIFAVAKASATFVILNEKLKKEQISHIIADCQIKGIVTSSMMHEAVLQEAITGSSLEFLIFANNGKYSSKLLSVKEKIPAVEPPGQDVACIIYTSGSTGRPKGVVITQENLIDGAEIVSEYLHCEHEDKVLSLLPFSFDYGLNQLLTTFMNGATIVLHNFVFPDDVLRIIEKEKITALAGIPTIWISLMNAATAKNYEYRPLRYITNSGGKIPVEYVKRMIDVFKHTKIYLMYGLTEAFRSTYLPPELVGTKPDSIGKAIPRVKISVLNKEGKECKADEQGELVHRGALISLGYWGNKEATDARIKELPEGADGKIEGEKGVFSGDFVRRDTEGFLYFLGRNDEMIKSSGYRISPTEIEEVLYKIDGLTGAVVFGRDDPSLGQEIIAVVLHKDKNERVKKEIIEHCARHLPDYTVPHEIIIVDNMPKTNSGKLDRSLIKVTYAKPKKD